MASMLLGPDKTPESKEEISGGVVDESLGLFVGAIIGLIGWVFRKFARWAPVTVPVLIGVLLASAHAVVAVIVWTLVSVAWWAIWVRLGWFTAYMGWLSRRDQTAAVAVGVKSGDLPEHMPVWSDSYPVHLQGWVLPVRHGQTRESVIARIGVLQAAWRISTDVEAVVVDANAAHHEVGVGLVPIAGQTVPDSCIWDGTDFAAASATARAGHGVTLALGANSVPITWPAELPHLLVVGATGSGKSVLVEVVALQAAMAGAEIVALDPKQVDLQLFDAIGTVATDYAGMAKAAEACATLVTERMRQCKLAKVKHVKDLPSRPRAVMLVVEEAAELLDTSGKPTTDQAKQEAEYRGRIRDAVTSVARLGRAADVRLVLAAQRADASILSGQLRAQLRARVVVRDIDPAGATMVEMPVDARAALQARSRPGSCQIMLGSDWQAGQIPLPASDVAATLLDLAARQYAHLPSCFPGLLK